MMKMIVCAVFIFSVLLLGVAAFGQTATAKAIATAPKPTVAPQTPQLSETEKIALSALAERLQEIEKARQNVLQHLSAIQADIEHAHPGYRFDASTGRLEPVEAPKK